MKKTCLLSKNNPKKSGIPNIMQKWSKLKKQAESFFAESVRGVVELRLLYYRAGGREIGRGYISVYGKEVWNMCFPTYLRVSSELSENENYFGSDSTNKHGVYTSGGYMYFLTEYCHMSFDEALQSDIPLIKSLAMLDRRLGKRRLQKMNTSHDHEMVQYFYRLRCELDGLQIQATDN